jgi:predicted Rossmann-fold nucleotide-binding protein
MCLLCDDEKAYQAYMNYLDAMAQQGKAADSDKAVDAVLDALEAADKASGKMLRDDPANDKTLSPFFCSPVNK